MKGIIYCIKEISTGEIIYIGSTTLPLLKRKNLHISASYNGNKDMPVYQYIRDNTDGKKENFDIVFSFSELQALDFEDKQLLYKLEREYIDKVKPICNINKPYVTDEERKLNYEKQKVRSVVSHKKKPEKYAKQHHDWVDNNREAYNEYRREYRLKKLSSESAEEKELRLKRQRDYMRKRREKMRQEFNQSENPPI